MEIHDIRYLHDALPKEEEQIKNSFSLSKQKIIGAGVVCIMMLSIWLVTLSITTRTGTTSTANEQSTPGQIPEDKEVAKEGTIVCLNREEQEQLDETCELGMVTDEGEILVLENVRYEDVASGGIVPGKQVALNGIVSGATNGTTSTRSVYYVTSSGGGGGGSGGSGGGSGSGSGTGSGSSSGPTATPTITMTPTPTPLPFSTPTPGVDYITVKYVVDNKFALAGTAVNLTAKVVSEQEPDAESCAEIDDVCSTVHFVVNDEIGAGRDLFYDTKLLTNTTEEEQVIFTPGQEIFAPIYVVLTEAEKVLLLLHILYD